LRVPVLLDRSQSGLTDTELRPILSEIAGIWSQAGICFEFRDLRHGDGNGEALVLQFVAEDVPFLNGYYQDDRHVWSEDAPRLARAPNPANHPAARTAAHEIGHALGLRHLPRTPLNLDGLMNTGYDGYRLSAVEWATARKRAARYRQPTAGRSCLPPLL
jgi:hypothetical protein